MINVKLDTDKLTRLNQEDFSYDTLRRGEQFVLLIAERNRVVTGRPLTLDEQRAWKYRMHLSPSWVEFYKSDSGDYVWVYRTKIQDLKIHLPVLSLDLVAQLSGFEDAAHMARMFPNAAHQAAEKGEG